MSTVTDDVTIHLVNVSTKMYPPTKYIKQYTHLKSGNTAVKMKYKLIYWRLKMQQEV